ncbi:MAG: carboxypeptidase regulatory-like domain-containing protein [Acidobacteriota bacterium]
MSKGLQWMCIFACLCGASVARAAQFQGQVTFNGMPLPGATITATQGSKTVTLSADENGYYTFADLADGSWKIEISMQGFTKLEQTMVIAPNSPTIRWEMKLLPAAEMLAQVKVVQAQAAPVVAPPPVSKKDASKTQTAAAPEPQRPAEDAPQASNDGLLINGSVNNAATSQYTLSPAFGNSRNGGKGLYTGGFAVILNNSALDARSYALGGVTSAKPAYSDVTTVLTLGGPIRIPHLMPRGPNFFVAYEWTRDSTGTTLTGLVPTTAQRAEALPGSGVTPIDPVALYLLSKYPLANVASTSNYNYQVPVLNSTHQDAMQSRLDKTIGNKNQIYGRFAFENSRSNQINLFGFVDKTEVLGLNSSVNWQHRFSSRLFLTLGFEFSRQRTHITPFFAGRENVSGGIGGNGATNDSANWGPPTLSFSSGISGLSDGQSAFNRNRTDGGTASASWYRVHHNFTFGGDFRREEFNYLAQQNARGSFTFDGSATGISDFADFLEGKAKTSSIAYGNADKYFRQSVYDAFFTDDWRVTPEFTLNAGIRWEYGAPMTELKGRIVNLNLAQGFATASAVCGSAHPNCPTGAGLPSSLIRPDRLGIEPRVGISWRPIPGSTLVIRGGYGVYDDTSVYESTALAMAQQSPISTNLSLNYSTCPSLFDVAFTQCNSIAPDPFAVDPDFRVGYAQTWQLSAQRDLPASMQATVTYSGVKGTRGVQEFLPNTYANGAANPCPSCPLGFVYRTSNGNSEREAGSVQLRRRLRNGLTASLLYTYSKSIDDDAILGGQGAVSTGVNSQSSANARIAQDWRHPEAERSLSTFDQRHLLNFQLQYTTGQGIGGGTLLTGWKGKAFKEWTVLTRITAGSGLPETPVYLATVPGTSVTGTIRPDRTAASIYSGPTGHALNAAAYAGPASGQWGNAGRDSIKGPNQFSLDGSLARVFRLNNRWNLDIRVDASNLFNHVVFSSWNTTLQPFTNPSTALASNPLFGLPAGANSMRSLQLTTRVRF